MSTKICSMCKRELASKHYHKNKNKEHGLHTECKGCRSKWAKIPNNRIKSNVTRKKYRHSIGVSTTYQSDTPMDRKTYRKHGNQAYKRRVRRGGKLSIKRVQLIYEDNIKKYGTLTCYLCLLPISFGKDHLEHKTPLSRGGTNVYENLAIACRSCNCRKHAKTEQEYRKAGV